MEVSICAPYAKERFEQRVNIQYSILHLARIVGNRAVINPAGRDFGFSAAMPSTPPWSAVEIFWGHFQTIAKVLKNFDPPSALFRTGVPVNLTLARTSETQVGATRPVESGSPRQTGKTENAIFSAEDEWGVSSARTATRAGSKGQTGRYLKHMIK
jgi:hypothetical protein